MSEDKNNDFAITEVSSKSLKGPMKEYEADFNGSKISFRVWDTIDGCSVIIPYEVYATNNFGYEMSVFRNDLIGLFRFISSSNCREPKLRDREFIVPDNYSVRIAINALNPNYCFVIKEEPKEINLDNWDDRHGFKRLGRLPYSRVKSIEGEPVISLSKGNLSDLIALVEFENKIAGLDARELPSFINSKYSVEKDGKKYFMFDAEHIPVNEKLRVIAEIGLSEMIKQEQLKNADFYLTREAKGVLKKRELEYLFSDEGGLTKSPDELSALEFIGVVELMVQNMIECEEVIKAYKKNNVFEVKENLSWLEGFGFPYNIQEVDFSRDEKELMINQYVEAINGVINEINEDGHSSVHTYGNGKAFEGLKKIHSSDEYSFEFKKEDIPFLEQSIEKLNSLISDEDNVSFCLNPFSKCFGKKLVRLFPEINGLTFKNKSNNLFKPDYLVSGKVDLGSELKRVLKEHDKYGFEVLYAIARYANKVPVEEKHEDTLGTSPISDIEFPATERDRELLEKTGTIEVYQGHLTVKTDQLIRQGLHTVTEEIVEEWLTDHDLSNELIVDMEVLNEVFERTSFGVEDNAMETLDRFTEHNRRWDNLDCTYDTESFQRCWPSRGGTSAFQRFLLIFDYLASPEVDKYYEVLGLDRGASVDDIKAAWSKKLFSLHPDITGSRPDYDKFQAVVEAKTKLMKTKIDKNQFMKINYAGKPLDYVNLMLSESLPKLPDKK